LVLLTKQSAIPSQQVQGSVEQSKEFKSLEQDRVFPFIKLDIILEQHFDLGAVKNFCIKNIYKTQFCDVQLIMTLSKPSQPPL